MAFFNLQVYRISKQLGTLKAVICFILEWLNFAAKTGFSIICQLSIVKMFLGCRDNKKKWATRLTVVKVTLRPRTWSVGSYAEKYKITGESLKRRLKYILSVLQNAANTNKWCEVFSKSSKHIMMSTFTSPKITYPIFKQTIPKRKFSCKSFLKLHKNEANKHPETIRTIDPSLYTNK